MSAPSSNPGATPSRVPTPKSGHHDAQWYRRVATKGSGAAPEGPAEGQISDDAAWSAVSYLVAGILLYGGIGWLVGHWLGHEAAFAAGGVLVGTMLAMFMLFRRLDSPRSGPETLREDRS